MDDDIVEYTFEWTLSNGTVIQSTQTEDLSDVLPSGTLSAPVPYPVP